MEYQAKLQAIKDKTGWTLKRIGEELGGVSRAGVHHWMSGNRQVTSHVNVLKIEALHKRVMRRR